MPFSYVFHDEHCNTVYVAVITDFSNSLLQSRDGILLSPAVWHEIGQCTYLRCLGCLNGSTCF